MTNGLELWSEILKQFPPQAIIAGGAVRDFLLGVEPKDIDVFIPNTPPEQPSRISFEAFGCPSDRYGLFRIDGIYERQAEYEALNNICLVSTGTLHGYRVDAIELTDVITPLELVQTFDFGINQCWFDSVTHITGNMIHDSQNQVVTLYHTDRMDRSLKRFERFNERHGNSYRLEIPC